MKRTFKLYTENTPDNKRVALNNVKTIKLFAALIVLSFLSAGLVNAEEKTKEFHESWPVSEVSTLQISNKFGEIKINNDGGSEVTIDVKVTVEAANEKRTNAQLD